MKIKLLFAIAMCIGSNQSHALVCWNSRGLGVVDELSYDLSNSFNTTNNTKGSIVVLTKSFSNGVRGICARHIASQVSNNFTRRSYVTDLPVVETTDNFKFLSMNEYLIGAMRITDSEAGNFYPPENYVQMGSHPNVSRGDSFPVTDSNFTFRIKVIKPFVGNVAIPRKTMFTVYVTTGTADPLSMPVYRISYSGSITVPQRCEINANQKMDINFGNISANAFAQAGVGNKPAGVNVQTRALSIQCTNITANALLTLRVESEQSTNDMIQSDNLDIGFKMADENGTVLLPNNLNSFIRFTNVNPAQVTLRAWPVSIRNNIPVVGPFRARGYLRVDFE